MRAPRAGALLADLSNRRCTDVLFVPLFLGLSCVPQVLLAGHAAASRGEALQRALAELPEGWLAVIGCAMGTCMLLGVAFLQIMRFFPVRLVVYGAILGSAGALAGVGAGLAFGDGEAAAPAVASEAVSRILAARGGDVLILAAVLELCVVGCFWKEIRLSVAVLRSTATFLSDAPAVCTIYPCLFAAVHFAGFALWVAATAGAATFLGADEGAGQIVRERYAVHSVLGLLLCYFWGNGLVTALSSLATARLAAEWYIADPGRKRQVGTPARAWQVVRLGLWKHGGSLALGALLLALLRVLSVALCWAGRNHRRGPDDSRLRRAWFGAREGAAGCLEGLARFASKQAVVEVALSGCGFFEGAARAARRAAGAPKRFAAVEGAGALQRAACEMLLVLLAGCAAMALWVACGGDTDELQEEGWVAQGSGMLVSLVLPACLGAWLVAESMMHPISVATSTLLHCWLLEDCSTGASHIPGPLRKLFDEFAQDDGSFAQHYS